MKASGVWKWTSVALALWALRGSEAEAQAPSFPTPGVHQTHGRTVTFSDLRLNGTGNVASVVTGATVNSAFAWAFVRSDGAYCVGCFTQWYLGITDVYSNCLFDSTARTLSGSVNNSFTAPAVPGIYYVQSALELDVGCKAVTFDNTDASSAVGALVVWPNVPLPSFVDVKPEAAGANCSTGGQKITVGNATNTAGVISKASYKVTYVCSGTDGADGTHGVNALVAVTDEAAGANCPTGGKRIQTGLDLNGNSQLDDNNVTTAYVCNGTNGANGEDGIEGEDGADGSNALLTASVEPAGDNCEAGGQKIESGVDLNGNGELDDNNVITAYVCNGLSGTAAAEGEDGHNAVVSIAAEPAGEHCATGGQRIDVGIDLNGNGAPDDGNAATTYVCNGAAGAAGIAGLGGVNGKDGLNGADGADGKTGEGGCSVGDSAHAGQGALWFGMVAAVLFRRRRRPGQTA